MSKLGLLKYQLSPRQLILFTLLSAIVNGIVTAAVGSYLAQTWTRAQARRQAIETMSHLVYERRMRAGMVVSSIRRGAEADEVRHRKRAYDDVYVEWNKQIRLSLFAIREVMGEAKMSALEQEFEDLLVAPLAQIDACLTQAYDLRIAGQDARPTLEACQMPVLHQLVLDCGAGFTNELFKLTRLSFLPWSTVRQADREDARARIRKSCARPAPPSAANVPVPPAMGQQPASATSARPSPAETGTGPASDAPNAGAGGVRAP